MVASWLWRGAVVAVVAAAVVGNVLWAYRCPDLHSVRGSVVIITGTSSGIGVELARQYGSLGANLILAARRKSLLEESGRIAKEAGAPRVITVPTDMGNVTQVSHLIDAARREFGRLDVLLLNHAAVDEYMVTEYPDAASMAATLTSVMQSNVIGSAMATREALPLLEASGGHVGVVSSASTLAPAPFRSAYVASKRALHGWFDTLRHELRLTGSRITIGIQVLGMIGTDPILRDQSDNWLTMPVPHCAAEMICAVQARWAETLIPKWYSPLTTILQLVGREAAYYAINNAYVFNVPEFVQRIKDASTKLAAATAGRVV